MRDQVPLTAPVRYIGRLYALLLTFVYFVIDKIHTLPPILAVEIELGISYYRWVVYLKARTRATAFSIFP